MKYVLLLLFFSFGLCQSIASQDGIQTNIRQNNLGMDYRLRDFMVNTKLQNDGYGEKYIGSFFLFDNWRPTSKVYIRGKEFTFRNVNFNVQSNEFISEVSKDSVFYLLPKYIDFIVIDDKTYKYQLYKGATKFFEVLYENNNKRSIYRGYDVRIIPKSDVGMLNRPYDEIKHEEKFFMMEGVEPIAFKLKKKEILNLIAKDKRDAVSKYIKENKLSYKKEKDVLKIFKYYDTI